MLFDVIPNNFFSPLASPYKIAYWECLERLFSVMNRQLSFGIERDLLVDELQDYFTSDMAADLEDEENQMGKDSRTRANYVLRRLESWGWISIETDNSYVQRVSFRDYAITVMKALLSVEEETKSEYQAYIYTIYLHAENLEENPGMGLLQIAENTDHLLTNLKSLNANIKTYIDNLTRHSTVAEILDALLNDYYTNIVDKAFHRLMTSDNVSKFRPEILRNLESCSRKPEFLQQASKEIAVIREIDEENAREQVLNLIHDVTEAFRSFDSIIEEINKKNTAYQRAAINRARFLLSSEEDLRGQIKNILQYMNEEITEKELDLKSTYELEQMDRLIRLFTFEYLDIDSLYAPVAGTKEFVPAERTIHTFDPVVREEKRKAAKERLDRILSPEKIQTYVDGILKEKNEIRASELPLREGDTFVKLIYIRLYGQRKRMGYRLELLDRVEKDGYSFRDYRIIRKTNGAGNLPADNQSANNGGKT